MDAEHAGAVVIGVDTGGTFTDVFASDGTVRKVPSTPDNPARAILEGLRALGVGSEDSVAHGTTVATNAVLERKGARTALLTTAGFEDVLEIRRQNRPSLYDLTARWPDPLVPTELRLGVAERLDFEGNQLRAVRPEQVRELAILLRNEGIEAVAVCLLFSYVDPSHEDAVTRVLVDVLGEDVSLSVSHRVARQYGEFERTSTTVVNAYVMPVMRRYLHALERDLAGIGITRLHVMQSNGGLEAAPMVADRPVHTVLSGPAAGVVGARELAARAGRNSIITFDMGGTSTDVAVVPGDAPESAEGEVASFPILVPMLTIETVGAGGGSIAWVDAGGGLHVGPRSAGADPGPAAYGKGTEATVTDANLVLGRLSPGGLLGGAMPLETDRARLALETIAARLELTPEETAWSIVRLANSNMERAVRTVTLQRGHDPRRFTLFPFGGAGPLHAVEMAHDLGISDLLIPPHPGVMAALGLTIPDLQRDYQQTVLLPLAPRIEGRLEALFEEMEDWARQDLEREDRFGEPRLSRRLDVRYAGQSFDLHIPYTPDAAELHRRFGSVYQDRYGYQTPEAAVEVVNVRLRVTLPRVQAPTVIPDWPEEGRPVQQRPVWFGSSVAARAMESLPTTIYWRPSLDRGTRALGPAIIEQYDSATLIPPGWVATVDDLFNLSLERT